MASYNHTNKGRGDLIKADEWNIMGNAIDQIYNADVDLTGDKAFTGSLSVTGDFAADGNGVVANLKMGNLEHGGAWPGIKNKNSSQYALIQNGDGTQTLINKKSGGGFIAFRVDNQNKMVVRDGGEVGIGTASPSHKLTVAGDIKYEGALIASFDANNPTANVDHIWHNDTAAGGTGGTWHFCSDLAYQANGNSRLQAGHVYMAGANQTNYFAGKVGIGIDNPGQAFYVKTGNNVGTFESTGDSAYLRLFTKEGIDNRIELCNRAGGRAALWVAKKGDVLNVTQEGKVGIGLTNPGCKLTVSSNTNHLRLEIPSTNKTGGKKLFLELVQNDTAPASIPETYPSILFHHAYRYFQRLEVRSSGFHFKTGDFAKDDYRDIYAQTGIFTGNLSCTGDLTLTGSNSWIFHTPNDGRTTLYIAPKISNAWKWENGFIFENTGKLSVKGSLEVGTSKLVVKDDGKVGIGDAAPTHKLEVAGDIRYNGALIGAYNDANNVDHIWFNDTAAGGTGGTWHFCTDTTYKAGGNARVQAGHVHMTGANQTSHFAGKVEVVGTLKAANLVATSPMHHRMYPSGPKIYHDIFDAVAKGVIKKVGSPAYNDTSYKVTNWCDRRIIQFGRNNEADGNGALVTVPAGYDTLWVRVLGERWNAMSVYFPSGTNYVSKQENLGLWCGGFRANNCYCPDGSLSDGHYSGSDGHARTAHEWVPIPVRKSGNVMLVSKPNTNDNFWLSGVAFSKNPWGHAAIHGVNIHWALNGGSKTEWPHTNWNNDVLGKLPPKNSYTLKIPVVANGKDKLFYIIEHNNNWNGCMHNSISVNSKVLPERFLASYDNPFARHWNNKFYQRYIAVMVPASYIPANAKWLNVKIDMSKQSHGIHFREMGTHDFMLS